MIRCRCDLFMCYSGSLRLQATNSSARPDVSIEQSQGIQTVSCLNRARKSRRTLQNKVRLKVLPEQLTLFVNTFVAFKKYIIQ